MPAQTRDSGLWRVLALLLLGPALFVAVGQGRMEQRHTIGKHTFCVPPGFVVASAADVPGGGDGHFDSDSPGGYLLVEFPLDMIRAKIPGFVEIIWRTLGSNNPPTRLHEGVSASIRVEGSLDTLRRNIERDRSMFPDPTPIPDPEAGMWRIYGWKSEHATDWLYVERPDPVSSERDLPLWGDCMGWGVSGPLAFECWRDLRFDGLSIEYDVAAENLTRARVIDQMIIESLRAWRCE